MPRVEELPLRVFDIFEKLSGERHYAQFKVFTILICLFAASDCSVITGPGPHVKVRFLDELRLVNVFTALSTDYRSMNQSLRVVFLDFHEENTPRETFLSSRYGL